MRLEYESELYHFGIKGQKWYRRRFQNDDGTLTSAGKIRYGEKTARLEGKNQKINEKASAIRTTGAKITAKGKALEAKSLKKGLLESQSHYEKRFTKQLAKGKALQAKGASYDAKAAKLERKAFKNQQKIDAFKREVSMKTDGKSLPQARMTDSKKTYAERVKKSQPFQAALKTAEKSGDKEGIKKLKSEMPGLTTKEQKMIVSIYKQTRKKAKAS